MNEKKASGFRLNMLAVGFFIVALLVLVSVFFARPLRQFVRELFMRRATSAHYEILSPPGTMSSEAMRQFVSSREPLFTMLDRKLDDAASNDEIQVVFYPDSPVPLSAAGTGQPYVVTGTTIRTRINGQSPQLDSAADAEALLHAAWGNPGSSFMGPWAAVWLVGESHGEELGMAAAGVEQRLGHKKLSNLLDPATNEFPSSQDRTLLGAAWLTEIAEIDGPAEVHKLYSAKVGAFNIADVAKTLGTTSIELERKWQMWIFAYLAGMPPAPNSLPMSMPMGNQ